MLPVLILLISILGSKEIFASLELSLKTVVAEAEQAARIEKKSVEALVTQTKNNVMQNQNPKKRTHEEGRCPIEGCTGLNVSTQRSEKISPLLDAKNPLIFVSASIPIESLKRLAYQAVQHGAILVIRGMVNGSMMETAKLVDQIDHPIEIDPKLFERFEIKQVPVFVIPYKNTWHKVAGNVELNFALESVNKDQIGHTQQKENK